MPRGTNRVRFWDQITPKVFRSANSRHISPSASPSANSRHFNPYAFAPANSRHFIPPSTPALARSGNYRINRVLRPTRVFRMDCDVLWSPLEWKLGDSIPRNALQDYAISPPVTRLRLTTALLPWPIDVFPSQAVAYGDPYVSVLDIFKAIYDCLKTPVTLEEYNRYGGDGMYSHNYVLTKKASLAFHKRCRSFGMDTMRRVDYLLGRTHFKGLVQSIGSPTEWEIIFD